MYYDILSTPIGDILITVNAEGELTELYTGRSSANPDVQGIRDTVRTEPARRQIEEYFQGKRREFDLRLAPTGTSFQRRVWAALLEIPFGETRSYGQIASELGNPSASRAVGRANGLNPISIIVPCHRVIGASGDLVGYGGGLPVKRWLLEFEGSLPQSVQPGLNYEG